ncbi:MAG: hypothetical protein KDA41_21095, partial [Planctomycetales bacterium]|nr:hypothetical protein [Planctomycetales bacterium]
SSRRRWGQEVRGKFAISIAAAVCSVVLLVMTPDWKSWAGVTALASAAASVAFAWRGIDLRRNPHR